MEFTAPAWFDYQIKSQTPLEIVPWCIYDSEVLTNGSAKPLNFFVNGYRQSNCITNQWLPGMLPNPMGFLIQKVRIFGVASDIALACFKLTIGNKIMMERPLWTTSIREAFDVNPGIFIPPLCAYRGTIQWDGEIELGKGITGNPIRQRIIQVAMFGKLARAIN